MVLDEISREDHVSKAEEEVKKSIQLDELVRLNSMEDVDLDSQLRIEVSGPRWH